MKTTLYALNIISSSGTDLVGIANNELDILKKILSLLKEDDCQIAINDINYNCIAAGIKYLSISITDCNVMSISDVKEMAVNRYYIFNVYEKYIKELRNYLDDDIIDIIFRFLLDHENKIPLVK